MSDTSQQASYAESLNHIFQPQSGQPKLLLPQELVLNVQGKQIDDSALVAIAEYLAANQLSVVWVQGLTDSLTDTQRAAVDIALAGSATDSQVLRKQFLELAAQYSLDINCLTAEQRNSQYRLAVFDMDSTLIKAEVIDELAKRAGVGEQVVAITEAAMQGQLDFKQSFTKRLSLLKGLSEAELPSVARSLTIMDGAERLTANLSQQGCRLVIASGGFSYFAQYLQPLLHIDEYHANTLDVIEGRLTGNVVTDIVDANRKAELLQSIAAEHHLPLTQTIAVGDGANDLLMIAKAGLGVAFRAKPIVQQKAPFAISQIGLDGLLYLLGYSDHRLVL